METGPTIPSSPPADVIAPQEASLPTPREAPAPVGLWGPWASLGLTVAILIVWFSVQAGVLIVGIVAISFTPDAPRVIGVDPQDIPHFGFLFALATIVSAPVGMGLAAMFARRRGGPPLADYLGLRPPTRRQALGWTLGLGVALTGYDLLARVLDRPAVPDVMLDIYRTALIPPVLWLAVVIAAPFFEETLFRGFLLPGLAASRLGAAAAVGISALLFASLHVQYDLFDVGSVLLLGVLFGAARLATGSLYLVLWLHALTNLIGTVQMAWYTSGAG